MNGIVASHVGRSCAQGVCVSVKLTCNHACKTYHNRLTHTMNLTIICNHACKGHILHKIDT